MPQVHAYARVSASHVYGRVPKCSKTYPEVGDRHPHHKYCGVWGRTRRPAADLRRLRISVHRGVRIVHTLSSLSLPCAGDFAPFVGAVAA